MYKYGLIGLAAVTLLMAISPSLAQQQNTYYIKGSQLLSYCEDTVKMMQGQHYNVSKSSWCIGFIQGSVTAHRFFSAYYAVEKNEKNDMSNNSMLAEVAKNRVYCIPSNVTLGQIVRDTVQFLEKNPKFQDEQASLSIARALSKAYPCHAQSKSKSGDQ